MHDALYGDEHELLDAHFIHDGQWQHYTPTTPPPTTAPVGVSTHVLQQMYDTTTTQPPPQQRYTARGEEERRGEVGGGVEVGVLEFGSEWDASGRVWDWVVSERRMEEAEMGQQLESDVYSKTVSAAATVGAGSVVEMDVMLKEFYL